MSTLKLNNLDHTIQWENNESYKQIQINKVTRQRRLLTRTLCKIEQSDSVAGSIVVAKKLFYNDKN